MNASCSPCLRSRHGSCTDVLCGCRKTWPDKHEPMAPPLRNKPKPRPDPADDVFDGLKEAEGAGEPEADEPEPVEGPKVGEWECDDCDRRFHSKHGLRIHRSRMHVVPGPTIGNDQPDDDDEDPMVAGDEDERWAVVVAPTNGDATGRTVILQDKDSARRVRGLLVELGYDAWGVQLPAETRQ